MTAIPFMASKGSTRKRRVLLPYCTTTTDVYI